MVSPNRLFLSQVALDRWLEAGRAEVAGEELTLLPEGRRFRLATGVHVRGEVTGAGDALGLVGRVKDLEQLAALGGDYSAGSVIVGDLAYEVEEGLLGTPIEEPRGEADRQPAELDALAQLFLEPR